MSEISVCLEKIAPVPGNLIRGLQAVQSAFGFVSDDAVREVSRYFGVTPAEIEGILNFYPRFRRVKPGRFRIAVCDGAACRGKGSQQLQELLRSELSIGVGETDAEGRFSLETAACLGSCRLAPAVSINGKVYGRLDRAELLRLLQEYRRR